MTDSSADIRHSAVAGLLHALVMLKPLLIAPDRRVALVDAQLTVNQLVLLMSAYGYYLAGTQYFQPSQVWSQLMEAESLEIEEGSLTTSISVPSLIQVHRDASALRQAGLLAHVNRDTTGPAYSITEFGVQVLTSALVRVARPLVGLMTHAPDQ